MFDFKLQQRAFDELNAEQFRLIYFLNQTLSMTNDKNNTPDNNKIEMFNGYLMDKLGLCERQVQRLIKSLEELKYISVERAKTKKTPNIITINNDINADKNSDKNVTLNKYNNIPVSNSINNNKVTIGFSTNTYRTRCNREKTTENNDNKKIENMNDNVINENSPKTETDKVIANSINNINLDKDVMYRAKSQCQYDMALGDIQSQMKKLKSLLSTEAYNNFRTQLGKWYKATIPYMKWDKTSTCKKKKTIPQLSKSETAKITHHLEMVKNAQSISEMENALTDIADWLETLQKKYPSSLVEKTTSDVYEKIRFLKTVNPIIEEWLKSCTGEAQADEVDDLPTYDITMQPEPRECPQIELYGNVDECVTVQMYGT